MENDEGLPLESTVGPHPVLVGTEALGENPQDRGCRYRQSGGVIFRAAGRLHEKILPPVLEADA